MSDITLSDYKIIPEMELVLQVHKGTIDFSSIKKLKSEICKQPEYQSDFNFIIDIRDAEVIMSREELIAYGNMLFDKIEPTIPIKGAVLVKTPEQIATTMVVRLNLKSSLIEYQSFSNVKSCLAWIGVPNSKFNTMAIEAYISSLKKEPVQD